MDATFAYAIALATAVASFRHQLATQRLVLLGTRALVQGLCLGITLAGRVGMGVRAALALHRCARRCSVRSMVDEKKKKEMMKKEKKKK